MSNFLQRIAASAAPAQSHARPRLQPMLGSIFAQAAQPAYAAAAAPMESGAAGAPEVYSESVMSWPVAAVNTRRAELLFPSGHGSNFYSASSLPPQRFAAHGDGPLLPGDYSGEEGKTAPGEPEGAAREDQAHLSGAVQSNSDERTGATKIRPLVAPPAIPVQSLRVAAPPRVDPVPRASAPRSEPDEIHIHIGRIEVAAVAPPTPRSAAPAPRKGINLDEYLRRESRGQR